DVSGHDLGTFLTNGTINPEGLAQFGNIQFGPGLDGFQVVDGRRLNVDGSQNPDYGRVVNFVQMPLPGGAEGEPHHMQYEWADGDPVVAGGLFNDWTWVMDVKDIPNMSLKNQVLPQETPLGSVPDAYDNTGDGTFIGTYMGGPNFNFAGSPGSLVAFKPHPTKGLVMASETPAGKIGGISSGNAGGVPEPCSLREARPLGTCANPHGIQARIDLKTMITSDYAEPRELTTDPLKPADKNAFRPTVRSWDISNPLKPVLTSVAHMPENPREFTNTGHENIGIMENAKTYGNAKGAFAGSMCGGGILFTPDITKLKGNASDQWVQVWDDGLSEIFTDQRDALGIDGSQVEEPGGCAGGAWHQVTKNNKWFYRSIQGRVPLSTNFYDQGAHKMIYNINIEALMKSAEDGKVDCNLTNGIDLNGDGAIDHGNRETGMDIFRRLAEGETVADCPTFNSSLAVDDRTTGGPHWAALDNNTLAADGNPTRMVFSDYFVARLGVDGNHRMYVVNIDPKTQKLSFDKKFRDEKTGAIGVDFNRRNWPNSPDAGFYKPHSMLWICPPGICKEEYKPGTEVRTAKAKAKNACTKKHIKASHRGSKKSCQKAHAKKKSSSKKSRARR
ncbi:MAG TPA: hypothetical protein VGV90_09290, partial [Solirubrobacteraceae bacterium]|nr:hypothetical protein [Solirubrobacteraceae bacterium]